MKPGSKIPVVFQIVEAVKDGELVPDGKGGTVEINNVRSNKWWAVPVDQTEPRMLVCIDHLDDGKVAYLEALSKVVSESYRIYH